MEKSNEKQKSFSQARRNLTVGLIAGAALGGVAGAVGDHLVETSHEVASFSTTIENGDAPGNDIYEAILADKNVPKGAIDYETARDAVGDITKDGVIQPGSVNVTITENGLGTYGVHVSEPDHLG